MTLFARLYCIWDPVSCGASHGDATRQAGGLVYLSARRRSHTASPTCDVDAVPPRSVGLGALQSLRVHSIACMTSLPSSGWPRKSSIIDTDQIIAIGLAMPLPAMSGAEPCMGSNMDGYRLSGLRLAPAAKADASLYGCAFVCENVAK